MSTGGFGCCKQKTQSNYVCLICHNVFHPDCITRGRKFKSVNGELIVCLEVCLEVAEGQDPEKLDNFISIIKELKLEIHQKDEHIKRLKRRSQAITIKRV